METIAVIDFETTGLSPAHGARPTEVAAVIVREGRIVDRYQSLMNAGVWVSPFIESYTGISNEMVQDAPSAARVMREVADFVGAYPLVAHKASFDQRFWDAELARIRRKRRQEFACSMLVARRIYPDAPNHQLSTLARYVRIRRAGRQHRALSDAELTANLVLRIEIELIRRFELADITHALLMAVQAAPAYRLAACVHSYVRVWRP